MDVFAAHREYFVRNGYAKHTLFNSNYLQEMGSEELSFYAEIPGYQRKAGIYLIDRWSSLGDFERAEYYQIKD